MKVQAKSFHLNGHIIGFRPQLQKLELPHKTLSNTLAVKGLKLVINLIRRVGEIPMLNGKIQYACFSAVFFFFHPIPGFSGKIRIPREYTDKILSWPTPHDTTVWSLVLN